MLDTNSNLMHKNSFPYLFNLSVFRLLQQL
uniref:Uncharacterized protein n=1 Tax=Siphoviridae sp. ctprd3 TaxID=2827943 RepID=A0A8S5TA64_9CAUD|nr:MAG TPA: hypothetical protein [Siphoviridae sp. ctprd3]